MTPPVGDAPDVLETQVERTELAWMRTSLASAGLGALAVHLSVASLALVPGLVLGVLVAAPGLVASWWRIRGLRATPTPRAPRPAGVAMLAGTVVLVDVATLVVLLR
jgi:uncharacterized membrane protein YidH (DUF202 family)